MKNNQENLGKVESLSTIIVNIGTIVSWAFSLFTFFVLAWQPEPISLPGILELSASYKILFLVSIFLAYIHLLRRFWEKAKRTHNEIEGSFSSFLYGSVIKFKRPLVFVGFFIILGEILIVFFETNIFFGGLVSFFGFSGILTAILDGNFQERARKKYDDDFRRRWLKRVKEQLHKDGYACTINFLNLVEEIDEINWAIRTYFDIYEFEKDLTFTLENIVRDNQTIEICEVRFKHVESIVKKLSAH